MPRKNKEIKAAGNRDQKDKLDRASKNIPAHLQNRIGNKLTLLNDESDDGKFYSWKGFTTSEDGELSLSYNHGEAANQNRMDKADKIAMELYSKYGENFWDHKFTETISQYADVKPRTIRNYRERVRSQNGKDKRDP